MTSIVQCNAITRLLTGQQTQFHALMLLQGKAAEGLITTTEYVRHKDSMLQDAIADEEDGHEWPEMARMKLLYIQVSLFGQTNNFLSLPILKLNLFS